MSEEKQRLREELAVARAVIAVQRQIQAAGHDPERVMRIVATTSQHLVGADGGVVELVDGPDLVYRAISGTVGVECGFRVRASGSLSGMCVQMAMPLRCDDALTDDRVDRAACDRVGLRSMVVVPLLAHDVCAGVLKVTSSRPNAFDEGTAEILEAMASFIATSLYQANEFAARAHAAAHDPLTGLLNRRSLLDRLEALLATAVNASVTLFFVDLDGFKAINDGHGHAEGDRLLCDVASRLRAVVRDLDTVARFGGDEFVVLCPGLTDGDADEVRNRIAHAAATPLTSRAGGASVGVARARPGDTAERLLERADAAMYAVKATRPRPGSPAARRHA